MATQTVRSARNNANVAPVSVVIPCYNCANVVERAVYSVVTQTLPPQEIILVNDGSQDSTLDVLYTLQRNHDRGVLVKVVDLQKNHGPGYARNTGWDLASQPYIAFLDADDTWHPKKLEIQYNWMKTHPGVVLTGHDCIWIREGIGGEKQYMDLPSSFRVQRITRNLLWSNVLSTPSVMIRRDLPLRFKPGKRFSEDYLLWLEIVLRNMPAFKICLPLAFLYKAPYGAGGLSGKLWEMEKGELETYWSLYKEGLLPFWLSVVLSGFSLAKFVRRTILVWTGKYG